MLKIIRRVLRLSGNLSKRIWGSFFCSFLESMFGLLPIVAVFFVLNQLQSGLEITGQTWGIVPYPDYRRTCAAQHFQISRVSPAKYRRI